MYFWSFHAEIFWLSHQADHAFRVTFMCNQSIKSELRFLYLSTLAEFQKLLSQLNSVESNVLAQEKEIKGEKKKVRGKMLLKQFQDMRLFHREQIFPSSVQNTMLSTMEEDPHPRYRGQCPPHLMNVSSCGIIVPCKNVQLQLMSLAAHLVTKEKLLVLAAFSAFPCLNWHPWTQSRVPDFELGSRRRQREILL